MSSVTCTLTNVTDKTVDVGDINLYGIAVYKQKVVLGMFHNRKFIEGQQLELPINSKWQKMYDDPNSEPTVWGKSNTFTKEQALASVVLYEYMTND